MFLLWAKNVCTYSPLAKLAVGSDFLNYTLCVESSFVGRVVGVLMVQGDNFAHSVSFL